MSPTITKNTFLEVRPRIAAFIHKTPVLTNSTIDAWLGCSLFFKCESFQRMGAFKMRGAANAMLQLSAEALSKGVATHSSGNFAQAVALSAQMMGVKAYIVMPENAPLVKKNAVKDYGGIIIECASNLPAREATVQRVMEETGATFLHPYNMEAVMLGQGTSAQELIEEIADLEVLVAPVGGGGLLGGTALAAQFLSPATKVYGAEPRGADDAWQSMQAGYIIPQTQPVTIADGLRTSLGDLTFPVIQAGVESIICVEEDAIKEAMYWMMERMKIVVEPSAAVVLAAVKAQPEFFVGKRVGLIVSGGNVDLKQLGALLNEVKG